MVDPDEADRERDAAVGRRDGSAVGRVAAGAGRRLIDPARRRADRGRRPRSRGRLHAGPRVASRQLLQRRHRHRVRRRHRRRPAAGRAASSCRRRRRPTSTSRLWRDSFARIGAWRPDDAVRHAFRPVAPVAGPPDRDGGSPRADGGLAKASLARDGDDEDREAWFTERDPPRAAAPDERTDAQAYEVAGRFDLSWRGLARYWRKEAD